MFVEKKRQWLLLPCHIIKYETWDSWIVYKVYTLWKDLYYPYMWNIREQGDNFEIQIFFTPLSGSCKTITGLLDLKMCIIQVKQSEESKIKDWLHKQTWASMV